MRKRSKTLNLTLMAGSTVALAACGESGPPKDSVPGSLVNSINQCVRETELSQAECEESQIEARQAHNDAAPRYDGRRLCEEQHGVGNCESRRSGGSSFFSPFFTGWIIGNLVDNALDGRRRYSYGTPYYRYRDDTLRTHSGRPIYVGRDANGNRTYNVRDRDTKKPKKKATVQKRTRAVSRRGFGSRSRGRSRGGRGWGG